MQVQKIKYICRTYNWCFQLVTYHFELLWWGRWGAIHHTWWQMILAVYLPILVNMDWVRKWLQSGKRHSASSCCWRYSNLLLTQNHFQNVLPNWTQATLKLFQLGWMAPYIWLATIRRALSVQKDWAVWRLHINFNWDASLTPEAIFLTRTSLLDSLLKCEEAMDVNGVNVYVNLAHGIVFPVIVSHGHYIH